MLLSALWSAKMQISFCNLSTLLFFICIKILVVLKIPIYIADTWCVYFRVLIWLRGTWSRGLPERFLGDHLALCDWQGATSLLHVWCHG
jgi:hypothetical protein